MGTIKKIVPLILVAALLFVMTACGSSAGDTPSMQGTSENTETKQDVPETDYYPYTYAELTDVAKKEQDENARPVIKDALPDMSQYDTVFIGAPVWWGDWPMIMYTFFESADLSGKNLIPFSTHEGSGLSGFDKKLSSAVSDANVLTGLAIRGNDCQNDKTGVESKVDEWLSGLGY